MVADGRAFSRVASLDDLVLGFLEDDHPKPLSSPDDSDSDDNNAGAAATKTFWEAQQHLLEEAMSMTCSIEARIARTIDSATTNTTCSCRRDAPAECRICRLLHISERLRVSGYDCALCKSKWKSSDGIPSGEHRYLDVIHKPTRGKRAPVRILIETSFRAEFEVARANPDYTRLVAGLPEVFVGRSEKLRGIIKVMCAAAKQCMKESGLHIGPWRKMKYMQAKWLSSPAERVAGEPQSAAVGGWFAEEQRRSPRSKASMLTSDLLDKLPPPPALHCKAVEVQ